MTWRVVGASLLAVCCFAWYAWTEVPPPSVMSGALTRAGIGAPAIALGTGYSAGADDSTVGYYNPAGLSYVPGLRIGAMYESKFDPSLGIGFQYLSTTYRLEDLGFGAGFTFLRRTDRDIPTIGGTFDASEVLALGSVGYDLRKLIDIEMLSKLALGGSLKLFSNQGFEDSRARGIGFDIGFVAQFAFNGWSAAIAVRSSDVLGSTLRWKGTLNEITETVPWGQHLGLCVAAPELGLRGLAEVSLYASEPSLNTIHLGAEYTILGIALRVGVNGGTPSIGVGVGLLEWARIDFAIVFYRNLGESLVASMEFAF